MNTLLRLFALFFVATGLTLTGCGDHDHEHGPDHDHEGHEDHDHDADPHDHDHDHDEHHDDHHGDDAARSLGTVKVGGSEFAVAVHGDVKPDAEVHLDIDHEAGPAPAAVRLWIGVESGKGSLRAKADGGDGRFHGHVEAPAKIGADTALWIEVEDADGNRTAGSLPLR